MHFHIQQLSLLGCYGCRNNVKPPGKKEGVLAYRAEKQRKNWKCPGIKVQMYSGEQNTQISSL